MKNIVVFLISCSTIIIGGFAKEFPENWKCAYGDGKCIRERITDILKNHPKGDANINLDPTDSIDIPFVNVDQGKESSVNINLKFKENKLLGINGGKAVEVKGFGKDIKGPHEVHLKLPSVMQVGSYQVNGRILLLPISGEGSNNLTFINPLIKLKMEGKAVERNGKTYMQISKHKALIEPENVIVNLQGLFNGDKALGDNMNKFLKPAVHTRRDLSPNVSARLSLTLHLKWSVAETRRDNPSEARAASTHSPSAAFALSRRECTAGLTENWRDIYEELRGPTEDVFGKVAKSLIGKVFESFPYEDFFIKEK